MMPILQVRMQRLGHGKQSACGHWCLTLAMTLSLFSEDFQRSHCQKSRWAHSERTEQHCPLESGFSTSALPTFWDRWLFVVREICCALQSVWQDSGLHPQHGSTDPCLPGMWQSRYRQMLPKNPWETKLPLVQNNCQRNITGAKHVLLNLLATTVKNKQVKLM